MPWPGSDTPQPVSLPPIQLLHNSLTLPNRAWCDQSPIPPTSVKLCKISEVESSSSQPLIITHCVTVSANLRWSLFVHNRVVQLCSALASVPVELTNAESCSTFLSDIDGLNICAGQPDDHLVQMAAAKKGVFRSHDGESIVASLDEYAPVRLNGKTYAKTIRTTACQLLVRDGSKCVPCKNYRDTLRTMYNRWSKRASAVMTETSSHTNERFLTTPERKAKMQKMRKRIRGAEQTVQQLTAKIEALMKHGESIDSAMHTDILSIMTDKTDEIRKTYAEGSFSRLFWEEQLRAASHKDPRQVRWHPLIIRWCLNLKLMSSSAYHAFRTAGFIKLPCERTLRDYTNYFESKPGFQLEVNKQLVKESRVKTLTEAKKFCGIVLDEMKVKENLVYNKYAGEVIGFTKLGSINDELLQLEQECLKGTATNQEHPTIATHLLVLLIRGIFIKLNFPYAHFATSGVTADLLFPIVWEAIRQVEGIGLKVLFITADGASPNRTFFRMHKATGDIPITYKTLNRYAETERYIYFFSDPPHLIKTTRNCWSHSGLNGTRLMAVSYIKISMAVIMTSIKLTIIT